jgi:ubiquitin carboxyl-terminal hydrolase 47
MGGHYYAYIKSFEDGKWYNFNDSDVRQMDPEDIKNVFGDKNTSATAYMLKYRQYNPATKENPITVSDDLIPEYLKKEIDTETCKMIEEQKAIEEKLLNLKLRIWYSPS